MMIFWCLTDDNHYLQNLENYWGAKARVALLRLALCYSVVPLRSADPRSDEPASMSCTEQGMMEWYSYKYRIASTTKMIINVRQHKYLTEHTRPILEYTIWKTEIKFNIRFNIKFIIKFKIKEISMKNQVRTGRIKRQVRMLFRINKSFSTFLSATSTAVSVKK